MYTIEVPHKDPHFCSFFLLILNVACIWYIYTFLFFPYEIGSAVMTLSILCTEFDISDRTHCKISSLCEPNIYSSGDMILTYRCSKPLKVNLGRCKLSSNHNKVKGIPHLHFKISSNMLVCSYSWSFSVYCCNVY
jgi:hypothetical protein